MSPALPAVAMFCRANKQGAGSKRGMAQQAHSKKRSRHAAGQSSGYNDYEAAWGYAPDLMCGVEGPTGYGAGAPAGGAFKVGEAGCETPSCPQFRSNISMAILCRRTRQPISTLNITSRFCGCQASMWSQQWQGCAWPCRQGPAGADLTGLRVACPASIGVLVCSHLPQPTRSAAVCAAMPLVFPGRRRL